MQENFCTWRDCARCFKACLKQFRQTIRQNQKAHKIFWMTLLALLSVFCVGYGLGAGEWNWLWGYPISVELMILGGIVCGVTSCIKKAFGLPWKRMIGFPLIPGTVLGGLLLLDWRYIMEQKPQLTMQEENWTFFVSVFPFLFSVFLVVMGCVIFLGNRLRKKHG